VDADAAARVLNRVPILGALTDAARKEVAAHVGPSPISKVFGAIAIGRRHIAVKEPTLLRKQVRY